MSDIIKEITREVEGKKRTVTIVFDNSNKLFPAFEEPEFVASKTVKKGGGKIYKINGTRYERFTFLMNFVSAGINPRSAESLLDGKDEKLQFLDEQGAIFWIKKLGLENMMGSRGFARIKAAKIAEQLGRPELEGAIIEWARKAGFKEEDGYLVIKESEIDDYITGFDAFVERS